jgi:Mrp family chromosome partitioning ATPase
MEGVLEKLKEEADFVIIDTPPVATVTDGLVLAPKLDGVVLVVESGRSPSASLQYAIRRLQQSKARILGVVLNKSRAKRNAYGYYSYGPETSEKAATGRKRRLLGGA